MSHGKACSLVKSLKVGSQHIDMLQEVVEGSFFLAMQTNSNTQTTVVLQ